MVFHAFVSLLCFSFVSAYFCCNVYSWNSLTLSFSLFSFSVTLSVFSFPYREITENLFTDTEDILWKKTCVHWLRLGRNFIAGNKRSRWSDSARSGSQSRHRTSFISPAHEPCHIMNFLSSPLFTVIPEGLSSDLPWSRVLYNQCIFNCDWPNISSFWTTLLTHFCSQILHCINMLKT